MVCTTLKWRKAQKESATKSRRKGFEVKDPKTFKEVFEVLPKMKNGKIVTYTHIDFKKAPKWEDVAPYRHCLNKILEKTKGLNVRQKSATVAMQAWVCDEGHDVHPEEPGEAIYRLRAMISQLANHKNRERPIPGLWKEKFFLIFDKVVAEKEEEKEVVQEPNTGPLLPMAQY